LTAAIRNAKEIYRIKHFKNSEAQFSEVAKIIEASDSNWTEFKEAAKVFYETSISRVEVGMFMDKMFPKNDDDELSKITENRRDLFIESFEHHTGNTENIWGLFNGYTYFLDHLSSRKNNGWVSSTFGGNSIKRQEAFDLCLEMAG